MKNVFGRIVCSINLKVYAPKVVNSRLGLQDHIMTTSNSQSNLKSLKIANSDMNVFVPTAYFHLLPLFAILISTEGSRAL